MRESKNIEPKLEDYRELILSCAEIFEDDLSRKIYSNLMTACISRNFEGLTFIGSEEQHFPLDIEMTKGYQSFMDCGAFCGDTLENLVKKNLTPKIYIAFEPDWRNFSKITQLIEKFNIDKALLFPCALSRNTMPLRFTLDQVHSGAGSSIDPNGEYLVQCIAIDECLKGVEPTFIKIDIEGNEIEALIGAKKPLSTIAQILLQLSIITPIIILRYPIYCITGISNIDFIYAPMIISETKQFFMQPALHTKAQRQNENGLCINNRIQ